MLSHTASHIACPSYASMVRHVQYNPNIVHTSNHVPGKPSVDLWQHLVEISRCSFYRAHKRKRQAEAVGALCDALQSMHLESSLCARFKRLCLDETEIRLLKTHQKISDALKIWNLNDFHRQ